MAQAKAETAGLTVGARAAKGSPDRGRAAGEDLPERAFGKLAVGLGVTSLFEPPRLPAKGEDQKRRRWVAVGTSMPACCGKGTRQRGGPFSAPRRGRHQRCVAVTARRKRRHVETRLPGRLGRWSARSASFGIDLGSVGFVFLTQTAVSAAPGPKLASFRHFSFSTLARFFHFNARRRSLHPVGLTFGATGGAPRQRQAAGR